MMLLMDRQPLPEPGGSCASGHQWVEQPASAWECSSGPLVPNTAPQRQPGGAAVGLLVPLGALAETYQSDGSQEAEGCLGAEIALTGFGSDSAATFTGVFCAKERGRAGVLLEQLAATAKQHALCLEEPCAALCSAVDSCQASIDECQGITGCAALASRGNIAYCAFGRCWVALGAGSAGSTNAIDLLSEASRAQPSEDSALSLASVMQKGRNAFGSLIPIDRTASLPAGLLAPHQQALRGQRGLETSHHFLVLGAGKAAYAMKASQAVERVQRLRERAEFAGKAATTLGKECAELRATDQDHTPTLVAILHFKLPRLPFEPAQQLPIAEEAAGHFLPGEGSLEQTVQPVPATLPRMLLSPSGRRVHFLPPIHGKDVSSPATQATNPCSPDHRLDHTSVSSGSTDSAARQSGGFPEGSSLLSSGSMLSQPNMAIPEEDALPDKHSALQLPPPLLAPIRKAYPSGEIRITPEMLGSPSPARKAKIGRAASVNSPEGLWPLPPQAQVAAEPCVRSSTGSTLGSCSRGSGEEGRVRGGLPRIASVPSRLAGSFASSPAASSNSSPRGSFNTLHSGDSFELPLNAEAASGKAGFKGLPRSSSAAVGASKKTRGQSSALRLLQAGRGGPNDPNSAPAGLLRLSEAASGTSALDADARAHSSGSETLSVPSASGSTGSKGSSVRRVPVLTELPTRQLARLSLVGDDGQESQRTTAAKIDPMEACQLKGPPLAPLIPQALEKGFRRNFSTGMLWPSRPDPAGMRPLNGLDLEGRQHSGGAFSSSSLAGSPETPPALARDGDL